MSETVLYKISNGVAHIALNRPDKYNSINEELALALLNALNDAQENKYVRAILLYGEGKGFCAGQDLSIASNAENVDFRKIIETCYNPIVKKITEMPKPVIAYVNGVAAGAGANLALCCDIVLASSSAIFTQAFSKIGLIPDTAGTWFLPKLVGYQRAIALTLTAEKVSADDAKMMGMVFKVYAHEKAMNEATAFAENLALQPTKALALTKKLIQLSYHQSLEVQLESEIEAQIEAGSSFDFKEGTQAFLQKREPVFIGS